MHSSLRQHALTQQKISKAFARSSVVVFCPLRQVQVALPDMGETYQPREQRYTFLSVCSILCVQQWYGCQCLGFLTCAQILMRAIAHGAVPGRTLQESLFWKLTQGEKISCGTGNSVEPASVLRPWLFGFSVGRFNK